MQARAGSAPFGYRRSPLSRLGRNVLVASDNTFSFPRRVFCARVLLFLLRSPLSKGGGAPRDVRVLARHPWACFGCRPGASEVSPWRFWAPVPRLPHRHLRRIGYSEL